MPLEQLTKTIESLQSRIHDHRNSLRQSEAVTRYALIDPLLRELGWDTADPQLVMPEYRMGSGLVDYALMADRRPFIVVEAKKMGVDLKDAAIQGIRYCIEDGVRYFAATDGRVWKIYETHKPVPIEKKLIVKLDLRDSPPKTALRSLILWRRSLEEGKLAEAKTPITDDSTVEVSPLLTVHEPKPDQSDQINRISLPDMPIGKTSKPPTTIHFPDGSSAKVKYWYQVTTESVRWLSEKGYLSTANCPVGRSGRYTVSTTPVHKSGAKFDSEKKVGGLFVETSYERNNHKRNAIHLFEHCGQDPSKFHAGFQLD